MIVASLPHRQLLARGPVGSDVIDWPQDSSISSARATAAQVTLFFSGVYRRVVVTSLARWPSCRR